jgi:hypothetical protein
LALQNQPSMAKQTNVCIMHIMGIAVIRVSPG